MSRLSQHGGAGYAHNIWTFLFGVMEGSLMIIKSQYRNHVNRPYNSELWRMLNDQLYNQFWQQLWDEIKSEQ